VTRKFLDEEGEGGDVLDESSYDLEVVEARAAETSKGGDMIWLSLKVLHGPDKGRVSDVPLNIPDDDASRGALFHFKKKTAAFKPRWVGVSDLPDDEMAEVMAERIAGMKIEAELGIQKKGPYAGSQELVNTKLLDEDDEPAPRKKKAEKEDEEDERPRKKRAPKAEPEEDDDDDDDEEEAAPRKKSKKARPEPEEDDDDDDDDEDDEEEPKKRSRSEKTKSPAKKKRADDDDDDPF
jgi:hypothetical protein